MKNSSSLLGAALGLALLAAGCETTGPSARIQEKSAAFATLKVWERSFIEKGVVATGFSSDMVYMAVGNPTKVEPVKFAGDGQGELWTYANYYPSADAGQARYAPFTTESIYQPATTEIALPDIGTGHGFGVAGSNGGPAPIGMSKTHQSISTTGGPQGGSMEPADLQGFTLQVLFQNGRVTRIGVKPN